MHPVSPRIMRAAQILTSLTMAAFMAVAWIPPLRRYAWPLRAGILTLFLIGCAVLTVTAFF